MNKIILALSLLAVPFTAQAQDKSNHFTAELIKTTADRFAPIFCSNDPHKIADAVKDCYLNTPPTDQKRLQCYLADSVLNSLFYQGESKALNLGIESANPYADISFASIESHYKRQKAIQETSGFEYLSNKKETNAYFDATEKVEKLINQSSYCQKKSK